MPDPNGMNTVVELMQFLGTPDRPVKPAEFSEFWKVCTDAEKEEFRKADLSKKD